MSHFNVRLLVSFLAQPFHFKPVMLQYVIFEVTSVLVLIGVSAFD